MTKKRQAKKNRWHKPTLVYCDRCDGCGWYEGGPTLQTGCEKCKGRGTLAVEGGAPTAMTKKPKPGKPKAKPIVLGRAKKLKMGCIYVTWRDDVCVHEGLDTTEATNGTLQFIPDPPKPKRGRR
jgi:hypothetical protein